MTTLTKPIHDLERRLRWLQVNDPDSDEVAQIQAIIDTLEGTLRV